MKTTLIIILAFFVHTQSIFACRCGKISNTQIYNNYNSIAVVRTHTKINETRINAYIEKQYKGKLTFSNIFLTTTSTVSGECTFFFQENKTYFIAFNDTGEQIIEVSKCSGSREITDKDSDIFISDFEEHIAITQNHKLPKKMYAQYKRDVAIVSDTKILYKNQDGTNYMIATSEALDAFNNILKNVNVIGLSKKSLIQLFGVKKPAIENNKLTYLFEFGKWAGIYEFSLKNNIVIGYHQIPSE